MSMHRRPRRKIMVRMIRLSRDEICWRCQGGIPVGSKAISVTGLGPRHYEHKKCHVPGRKRNTERKPGPVTIRWVDPRPSP
jgi:hypothetical protein